MGRIQNTLGGRLALAASLFALGACDMLGAPAAAPAPAEPPAIIAPATPAPVEPAAAPAPGPSAAAAAPAPLDLSGLPEPLAPFRIAPGDTPIDMLKCLERQGAALISAHRGGVAPGFPENAIETFANTLAQAPMILEIDVRQTADGVLVLMHDDDLARTTTGTGEIAAVDFATLRSLRLEDNDGAATDFRAPTLVEALRWARGRAMLQLDVKRGVDIAEVVRTVRAEDAAAHAAVIAYTVEDALAAAAADPEVALSIEITDEARYRALVEEGGVDPERLLAWTGVERAPIPDTWDMLSEKSLPVAFGALWYIDEEVETSGDDAAYARIAAGGVDIIATDRHPEAYAALETRQDTVQAVRTCSAGR